MINLEDIARAAIDLDALRVRSLVQDWLAEQDSLSTVPAPSIQNSKVRSVAAALVELLASRRGELPPNWIQTIGALDEPLFLVSHAATMSRLRRLCEQESPYPLRWRRIYAPPGYLTAA